ncbi:hypothetical protein BDN71DRAFT_1297557 [Pleurotus eryngii]|uniref:Uncharacterized protein n=1 Tax=Pleurotus eryngii TaxID=5323 RepID=A0A9P5ZPJ0_PLEER|nr:hypothetical protein BDN71DRAFT_1297557 [Pleurotus eryngii]
MPEINAMEHLKHPDIWELEEVYIQPIVLASFPLQLRQLLACHSRSAFQAAAACVREESLIILVPSLASFTIGPRYGIKTIPARIRCGSPSSTLHTFHTANRAAEFCTNALTPGTDSDS